MQCTTIIHACKVLCPYSLVGAYKSCGQDQGRLFWRPVALQFFFCSSRQRTFTDFEYFFKILSNIKGLLKYFVITFRGAGVKSKYYN